MIDMLSLYLVGEFKEDINYNNTTGCEAEVGLLGKNLFCFFYCYNFDLFVVHILL